VHHAQGVIGILRPVSRRRCTLIGFLAVAASAAVLPACGGSDGASKASGEPAGAAF
jgi:hypothetical protein